MMMNRVIPKEKRKANICGELVKTTKFERHTTSNLIFTHKHANTDREMNTYTCVRAHANKRATTKTIGVDQKNIETTNERTWPPFW